MARTRRLFDAAVITKYSVIESTCPTGRMMVSVPCLSSAVRAARRANASDSSFAEVVVD